MSGGYWDYIQGRVWDVACDVKRFTEPEAEKSEEIAAEMEEHPELLDYFKESADLINEAANRIKELDWYLCGDTSAKGTLEKWRARKEKGDEDQ